MENPGDMDRGGGEETTKDAGPFWVFEGLWFGSAGKLVSPWFGGCGGVGSTMKIQS